MVQENKQEQSTQKDPGSILRAEREAQGLSIEMVHEETKIPMDALRAIEEGYSIRTMSSFYYKGFVKMYAKYLNVDPHDVISEPVKRTIPRHEKIEIVENPVTRWMSNFFTKRRKQRIVLGVGLLIAVVLLFNGLRFIIQKMTKPRAVPPVKKVATTTSGSVSNKNSKAAQTVQVPKTTKPVAVVPVKSAGSSTQTTDTDKQGAAIPLLSKNVTLTVRAKEDSWLRVKVDGNVVFQSTLRLGTVETWLADKKIEISGKNINQLEFELNGKMIGALGRKGRTIKQIEATKDGFNVIK